MADFDHNYNDWGYDDYTNQDLSLIDDKKLSKEERKKLLAAEKQAKMEAQSARRQKRLAELIAMEEAENKEKQKVENTEKEEEKTQKTEIKPVNEENQEKKGDNPTFESNDIENQQENKEDSLEENKTPEAKQNKPNSDKKQPKDEKKQIKSVKEAPIGNEETGSLESPQLDKSDSSAYLNSLGSSSPTDFMMGVSESGTTVKELQQKEQTDLQDNLPEIDQPTGLPTKDEKGKVEKGSKLAKDNAKALKAQPKTKENPKDKIKVESKIDPSKPTPTQKERAGVVERIKSFFSRIFGSGAISERIEEIKESIDTIPSKDESIKEDLGRKPEVRLVGEADPEQNEQQKDQAEKQTLENKQKADQEIQKDFGENNLYPEIKKEKLKPQIEIVALEKAPELSLQKVEKLPAQAIATFNENAKQQIDAKIQQGIAKEKEGKLEKESKSEQEKKATDTKIADETSKVEAEQKIAQKKSQQEVEQNRKTWKQENDKILDKAQKDLDTEKNKTEKDISSHSEQVNKEIGQEYEKGDKAIKQEKVNTEKQAEAKKAEAKNKKRSFWEKVGDAFSSFIEGIKNAINSLFDALKRFVKNTIERVKKIAVALIDKAKNFAIKMVKAYGEFAKGVVSIVLFAFPETAKKINGLIDKAVDKAEQAINYLADKLKVAVCKFLDALGAVLVALLSVYQALFLALLGDFSMIADFLMKIYNGVKGLIQGARHSVSESLGALSEEFLGADISNPLDIERSQEEENQYRASELGSKTNATKQETQQNGKLSDKNKLNNDDVEAPGTPFHLGQEFLPFFSKLQEGQDMILGGAGENAVTTQDLQGAMFGGNPLTQQGEDEMVTNLSSQLTQTENSTPEQVSEPAPSPDVASMTDEAKMDYYIGQMDAEAKPESMETKQPPEAPQKVNLDPSLKTSPLPVGTRLEYVGRQMMKGLQMWWNQNKMTVYAVIAGVLTVGAIIAFFTGGAGLIAVLEVIMQALTVIFMAEALMKIRGHLMNYLELSWNQKPKEGGKELAKGFAVLVSEFLFEYLLAKLGNVLKRVKATIKASKAYRRTSVAIRRTQRKVGNAILNIPGVKQLRNVIVKNGKYVINGLNSGITKGVKNLQDLRERILKVFGFKRVWAEKHGSKIEIWGEFNSRILIATLDQKTGKTTFDDRDLTPDEKRLFYSPKRRDELGQIVYQDKNGLSLTGKKDNLHGLVIGDSLDFLNKFDDLDDVAKLAKWEEMLAKSQKGGADLEVLRKELGKLSPPEWAKKGSKYEKIYKQRKHINSTYKKSGGKIASDEDIHHLTTIESMKHPVLQRAVDDGFMINHADANGIKLRSYSSKKRYNSKGQLIASPKGTHASHPNYNDAQEKLLQKFAVSKRNRYTNPEARSFVESMNEELRHIIQEQCIDGGKKIDEVFKNIDINKLYSDIIATQTVRAKIPSNVRVTYDKMLAKGMPKSMSNIHNRLINGGINVVEDGGVLKYLDKNGAEIAKLENGVFSVIPDKGKIPTPDQYLSKSYIAKHIDKFKKEGAGFIVVKSWTENGRYGAMPARKFVGLRSEMDAVIAKYKASGNDWKVLRDELNLGHTTDLSLEEIYYIKVDGADPRFNFEVPNGNEAGAIIGEWVPGGYTKNGVMEAALINSETVIHNKDINQFLNNFTSQWEKIK
ncbi:hypothetical protein AD998_14445 [bacterium 336/3]|nr:hypothetical protein AD998_14445 [bacterium 336/3]